MKKNRILIFLIPLWFNAPAMAGGFYVDLSGGVAYFDTRPIEQAFVDRKAQLSAAGGEVDYDIRDTDTGGSFTLGYRAGTFWGMEAGFMSFGGARVFYREREVALQGTVNDNYNEKYAVDLYHLSLQGVIPLSTTFEFLPKVGMARWRLRYRHQPFCSHNNPTVDLCAFSDGYTNKRIYGNSLLMGAALRYALTRHIGVKLNWDYVSNVGILDESHELDAHLFGLGLDYRFFQSTGGEIPEYFVIEDMYAGLGITANALEDSETGTGFQVYAGYRFPFKNDPFYYALELGYLDSGEMNAKVGDTVYTAAGAWLSAVVGFEMHPQLDITARFGADFGNDRGALYGLGLGYEYLPGYTVELAQITRDHVHSSQLNLVYYLGSK